MTEKKHHLADDLVGLFNDLFARASRTELVAGGDEPFYRAAINEVHLHQIIFTKDYFASALHEISHWCIAGEARRLINDYGYWYEPDGRSIEQQQAFEWVEAKPQALEWIFSVAAGISFTVSSDNLNAGEMDSEVFKARIYCQVRDYLAAGLPERAQQFVQGLLKFYDRQQAFLSFQAELLFAEV